MDRPDDGFGRNDQETGPVNVFDSNIPPTDVEGFLRRIGLEREYVLMFRAARKAKCGISG